MRPEPKNMAASVRQRLKNRADTTGERFNDLLQHYGLERSLARLAASPHQARFVLKGALLLRVWDLASYRPTRDIDLLGYQENSAAEIERVVRDICATVVEDDGLQFDINDIEVVVINSDAEYSGVRATFAGRLGSARIAMQIDIGFGDQVTPAPIEIEYPSILHGTGVPLRAYTPETSIAEKFQGHIASRRTQQPDERLLRHLDHCRFKAI